MYRLYSAQQRPGRRLRRRVAVSLQCIITSSACVRSSSRRHSRRRAGSFRDQHVLRRSSAIVSMRLVSYLLVFVSTDHDVISLSLSLSFVCYCSFNTHTAPSQRSFPRERENCPETRFFFTWPQSKHANHPNTSDCGAVEMKW